MYLIQAQMLAREDDMRAHSREFFGRITCLRGPRYAAFIFGDGAGDGPWLGLGAAVGDFAGDCGAAVGRRIG